MSSLSSISGTKLSQHAHTSSPTGTKLAPHTHTSSPTGTKLSQHAQKRPFQPVLPEQGELCTALTITMPSRENFVPRPAPNPVQNSPCSAGPSAQPVQNSPHTSKKAHFSPFCPSRENFVPPPPPRSRAGRTLYRTKRQTRYKTLPAQPVQGLTRYKTLPTHPHQQPNRYKTLPTRTKRPISACFARAGRTMYRSHHHDPQQGELCTAPSAKPGTKLSQHTRSTAVPRKSSPSTPKNGVFASFASAGRIISRTGDRTGSADEGRMR